MLKFLHLSDLHFRSKEKDNREITAMLEYIQIAYPEHKLIITGDITDDGDGAQYKRAFDALKPFIGRIFLCPGNHDGGPLGNIYDPKCFRQFNNYLMAGLGHTQRYGSRPIVHRLRDENTDVILIGLNSVLRTKNPFDFACGQIGWLQRWRLDWILMDSTTRYLVKIIYLHHHPFYHGLCVQMLDANKFLRILAAKAEIVLFGHRHVSGRWNNLEFVNHFLAADKSPESGTARELCITGRKINIQTMRTIR